MTIQSGPQRPLAVMMCRTLCRISPEATLLEAARLMRDAKVGALLVYEAGYYSGLVSESDLVRKGMAEESCSVRQTLVRAVMSRPLLSIDSAKSAHDASEKMAEHSIRHLAVSEEGQIVGIISVRDLLRYFKNWGDL
jgi:CBS domain-containing protein